MAEEAVNGGRLNGWTIWAAVVQLAKSSPTVLLAGVFLYFMNQENGRNRETLRDLRSGLEASAKVSSDTVSALNRLNEEFIRRNTIADRAAQQIESNTRLLDKLAGTIDRLALRVDR